MLGKVLIGLLVAAGAFLVYSLFAGGTANAAGSGTSSQAGAALGDFNKWVTGGQARSTSDPTVKAWTNYAASLPKMDPKQTQAILATRRPSSGIGGVISGR